MAHQEEVELPKGWIKLSVEDIAEVKGGKRLPKGEKFSPVATKYPYIRVTDFLNESVDVTSIQYISEDIHQKISNYTISVNDLYISIAGTIGLVGGIPQELNGANLTENAAKITSLYEIEKKYLLYVLNSPEVKSLFSIATTSSGQPKLALKRIRTVIFPMAPLAEQKRIVEKLDSLLVQVDTIQQRLNNLPDIIKRFRQSVLAAAVSGKLTEQWRDKNEFFFGDKSIEKITELVDSFYENKAQKAVANGKRKPKHPRANKKAEEREEALPVIPSQWKYQRLEDITYLVSDGTHKTPKYKNEGVPFFSVKNVRPFKVSDANIKFVSQDEYEEIDARCNSEENDILYTKVGATFGFAARNTITYNHAIYVSLALIKPVFDFFDTKYAELVMNSPVVFEQARKRVSGSGVPDLHLIEIRDFKIPVPHIEEQTEIVRLVEQYFALADTLEKNLANAKQRVDNLTQSILAKAFRGEIVPQDPNDEPADKLLARIKAARLEAEKLEKAAKKAAKASKK